MNIKTFTTLALMAVSACGTVASAPLIAYDGSPQAGTSTRLDPVDLTLEQRPVRIWNNDVGEGFRKGVVEAGFEVGAGIGHQAFGSRVAHDFALAKLHLGRMVGGVVGEQKWYRGNWEVRGELFAGGQFNMESAYLVGLTPVLRYNFATSTRWLPFVDVGAGVMGTDIGRPDLSTTFQFNTQVGAGVRRFFTRNSALTLQYRYIHISNAGIDKPNYGANTSMFYIGMSWFF